MKDFKDNLKESLTFTPRKNSQEDPVDKSIHIITEELENVDDNEDAEYELFVAAQKYN